MELRPVGATGIRLSPIGLGGYELGAAPADVPAARAAIEAALDSGVNWLDTAEAYSDTANETVIGGADARTLDAAAGLVQGGSAR
jgi:aryl-alcohol dehydrogenase-like predicted oxidoreductase